MTYKCSKEKEIDKLVKTVNGNGKLGLVTITQGLSDQIGYLTKTTDSIKTDIKILLTFQTQIETREEERHDFRERLSDMIKEKQKDKRWKIGLLISTILAVVGLIITITM